MNRALEDLLERLRGAIALDEWAARDPPDPPWFDAADWSVFADALLDEGDERGTLVELECRWRQTGRRSTQRRLLRLAWNHTAAWQERLDPWTEHHQAVYAGFLASATVTETHLSEVAQLLATPEGRLFTALRVECDPTKPLPNETKPPSTSPSSRRGLASLLPPAPPPRPVRAHPVVRQLVDDPAFAQIRNLDLASLSLGPVSFAALAEAGFAATLLALTCAVDEDTWPHVAHGPWRPRALALTLRRPVRASSPRTPFPPAGPAPALSHVSRLTLSTLDSPGASVLAAQRDLAELRDLHLTVLKGSIDGLGALLVCPAAPSLRRVTIDHIELQEVVPSRRWHATETMQRVDAFLRWPLHLSDDETVGLAMANSGALSRLQGLTLRFGGSPGAVRGLLVEPLPALQSFAIGARHFDTPSVEIVIERLTGLRRLQLGGIGDEGAERIASRRVGRGLEELRLGGALEARGIEALAQSPHLAGLRALAVIGRGGDDLAKRLAASPYLRPETLSVFFGQTDEGWKMLLESPVMGSVRHLQLSVDGMTEATVARLLAAPNLAGLEHLTLEDASHDFVSKEGRALAKAREAWPALRDIVGIPVVVWADS